MKAAVKSQVSSAYDADNIRIMIICRKAVFCSSPFHFYHYAFLTLSVENFHQKLSSR